jgi:iron complex outermembrane receptor protein
MSLIACLVLIFAGWQSEPDSSIVSPKDTLVLSQVEVHAAAHRKYAYGQFVRTLHKDRLAQLSGYSLGEVLQQETGLFLRQYGPGMLTSLSMRGTSAGHNALFWNGLPVNSPSLGQADYSIFPSGGFDEVNIHYGSSGALYGTDAIGGSVHLFSDLKFNTGKELKFGTLLGSFGRWHQQVSYRQGNENLAFKTNLYRNYTANNFTYKDYGSPGTPEKRQDHARVSQIGLVQNFAYSINAAQILKANLWVNSNERQIQPLLGSSTNDVQEDRSIRAVIDYSHSGEKFTWTTYTGISNDVMVFNSDRNETRLFLLGTALDYTFSQKWQTLAGIRFSHIKGQLATYNRQEQRIELYQATNFRPSENLGVSMQLRQLIHDGEAVPFTPSLGVEWTFFESTEWNWQLISNLSRSFKIPTLNDRFWVPGGNPNLKSEKSLSKEIGITAKTHLSALSIENRLTYFHMNVDDWILWLPQSTYWQAENVRDVVNHGLEYFFKGGFAQGKNLWTIQVDYSLNSAVNQSGDVGNSLSQGKQLPYVPKHKIRSQANLQNGPYKLYIQNQWTGERYVTTDNQTHLAAYSLWDIGLTYAYDWKGKLKGNLGFHTNNIFNVDYQVLRLRSMPGRNFQFNLNVVL